MAGSRLASSVPAGNAREEAILHSLGYKQELKREFTPLELFGIGFSWIGLVSSIASSLIYALPNGGSFSMIWGWAICMVFMLTICLAIAELGSSAPTAGGLYYWTFTYASPRWRRLLCWIGGHSNTICTIAGIAGATWGAAVQVMAAASIGSNLAFTPTNGQIFGCYAAILLAEAMLCSCATRVIASLQKPYVVLNMMLILGIIIALPAATPKEFMNDAKSTFTTFENLTLWPNGFAFTLSFLTPVWTVGCFDTLIHLSEEASNASVALPWAIISANVISGVLGWFIMIAIAFCMGQDVDSIVSSPIGQPLAAIFYNSFGRRSTLAFWAIILIFQFMTIASGITVTSRQVFAFSRDGALPLSRYLYRINPYTGIPVNCVWFATLVMLALGLLSFAGSAAIGAVFTLGVASQYIALCIPITSRFIFKNKFQPGPFSLGRWGRPVALVAVLWMMFCIVIFMFPTDPSPLAQDMNYTIVVLGGILFLCIVYYYFPRYGGVHWFQGPARNVDIDYEKTDAEQESGETHSLEEGEIQ
ncbi:amino acid transporter [Neolentinus lepideus HHB14362 ss-1]|uniref:Amino acid transporter n=1 Tax=Neolentinus lepideus HHB14362 ss-1 TaxID=1314782 RepID=A0A165UP65_9AGAM|nr:amino acid transporter [Neolentinus lepideus HHB14362 ss-1]